MKAAPLIGISRHRLSTDGEGVTTLVAFQGARALQILPQPAISALRMYMEEL